MIKFSYQLYSSRNFPPLSNTFDMLSHAGYQQVEGYSTLLNEQLDPHDLRELLDDKNLHMATSHFDFDSMHSNPKQVIEIANILNMSAVYVSFLEEELRPVDAAGWEKFGRELAEIGKPFRDAGLIFGWHNHAFEFANIGITERPIDLLLSACDHLSLELDVAWVALAGANPFKLIEKYSARITAAHIKDIAPNNHNVDEDGWANVGYGTLDWPSLYSALRCNGTKFFVIEHDNPNDDKRFAERSLAFLKQL